MQERVYLAMMDKASEILESAALSKTGTRLSLLNIFLASEGALSLASIETSMNNPDRITLYRNLKTFEAKGIIHKALDGTNHPKYALCDVHCQEHNHQDNHPHFHCVRCEKTVCLEEIITPQIGSIPDGYEVQETNLILTGVCSACS